MLVLVTLANALRDLLPISVDDVSDGSLRSFYGIVILSCVICGSVHALFVQTDPQEGVCVRACLQLKSVYSRASARGC